MPQRDIVVIGGSAGALPALTAVLQRLPRSLQACVLVVVHTRPETSGALPAILTRSTDLPVDFAQHDEPLRKGRIYVARPDFQLLVENGRMIVARGPRENGFRPAIDPLFRTAARSNGPRVAGVILSGALDDGTHGLSQIKQHGGVAIVQDPEEAVIPSMPSSALRQVAVDYVLAASDIPRLIVQLTRDPQAQDGFQPMASDNDPETALPNEQTPVRKMEQLFGAPSALTCPDCGGSLWEVEDGRLIRYRCHVGHQYAPDSLAAEQRDAVEAALWRAVRVLEEHAALRLRMARRADAAGLSVVSEGFAEGARSSHRQAQEIRARLFGGGGEAPQSLEDEAAKPAVEKGTRKAKRTAR